MRETFLDQLCGAAYTSERVLAFVGEHSGHAAHGAHRPAMQKLTINALGQAPFLKKDGDRSIWFHKRRRDDIGDALAMTRCRQIDVALADGRSTLTRLRDELDKRTPERNEVIDPLAQEEPFAGVEELFGRRIHEQQFRSRPDDEKWHRQCARNLRGCNGVTRSGTDHPSLSA